MSKCITVNVGGPNEQKRTKIEGNFYLLLIWGYKHHWLRGDGRPWSAIPCHRFIHSATSQGNHPMAGAATVLLKASFWNSELLGPFCPFHQVFENNSLWSWFGVDRLGAPPSIGVDFGGQSRLGAPPSIGVDFGGQPGHVPPNNWGTPMHLSLFTTFCPPIFWSAHPIFLTSQCHRGASM